VVVGFDGIAVADSRGVDWTVKKAGGKSSGSGKQGGRVRREKNPVHESGQMRLRIEAAIRSIPKGKVSTYGGVARAAGFPGAARLVARVLNRGFGLPWQRVLGAGGEIKLRGDSGIEQRLRLEAEGVRFRGRRVDMKQCEWKSLLSNRKPGRPSTG
jgi:methylated-DNA-protein-cysteine methyltransferase related protein